MTAYLVECGNYIIIYIKDLKKYFFIDDNEKYLADFIGDQPEFSSWTDGHQFKYQLGSSFTDHTQTEAVTRTLGTDVDETILMEKFIDPTENPGAVIAVRHAQDTQPIVYNNKRFTSLIKHRQSD